MSFREGGRYRPHLSEYAPNAFRRLPPVGGVGCYEFLSLPLFSVSVSDALHFAKGLRGESWVRIGKPHCNEKRVLSNTLDMKF